MTDLPLLVEPFFALIFLLGMLPALWGFGRMATRLIRLEHADEGLLIGVGLVVWVAMGGCLIVMGAANAVATGLIWVTGVLLWVNFSSLRNTLRSLATNAFDVSIAVAALLALCFSAQGSGFNSHDDFHGYLVMVERTAQSGGVGADPFLERGLYALGAMTWLQLPFRWLLGPSSLVLTDVLLGWGIAWILVGASLPVRFRRWGGVAILGLAIMAPAGVVPAVNMSALFVGMALLLVLFRTLACVEVESAGSTRAAVLTGIAAAAVISLKLTFLPAALMSLALLAFVGERHRRMRNLGLGILAFLVAFAPWGVVSQLTYETALYPLLGQGIHAVSVGRFPDAMVGSPDLASVFIQTVKVLTWPQGASLIILGLGCASLRSHKRLCLLVLAVGLISAIVLAVKIDIRDLDKASLEAQRYAYPTILAAILFCVTHMLRDAPECGVERGLGCSRVMIAAFAGIVFPAAGHWRVATTHWYYTLLGVGTPAASVRAVEGGRSLRDIQELVPEGEKVLARLSQPFKLDFVRNTIFVVDWPCGTSPSPGLPCDDAVAMTDYLTSIGVSYILYSHGDEGGFSREDFGWRLRGNGLGRAARSRLWAQYTFDFQVSLDRVIATHTTVYRDDLITLVRIVNSESQE